MRAQVHHVTVRGGPGGYEAFIGDIRRIFGITAEHDMQLAFDCADPVTGALQPAWARTCLRRMAAHSSVGASGRTANLEIEMACRLAVGRGARLSGAALAGMPGLHGRASSPCRACATRRWPLRPPTRACAAAQATFTLTLS